MKRQAIDLLIKWKQKSDRKPLIIKGVRQCGKTYLIKEFGQSEYEDVAYFNFEGNRALQERFSIDLDVKRIITELGVLRGKVILPRKTLLIFDEIQFCNAALTSLKYFCENAPEYHIICAGSLLGIALSKPLSFPVGKVDFITLRPMTFYEFLLAKGEIMLCEYVDKLPQNEKLSKMFGDKLETLLREFYITGGMPEAVEKWITTNDIEAVEEIQQKILDSYELDFAKHAPSKDFPKLTAIWQSIPEQLSKENRKFIFSRVKKGLRAKDLEDALEWLISAGLAYKVNKIEKPFIPLSSYADQTFFKLYLADIGLLRKMAGVPAQIVYEKNPLYKEFKGAMTENYVLCELIAIQEKPPFFWRSDNEAEVDFVMQLGKEIVPIEVKSEDNDKAKSLSVYRKKYNPSVSIITQMDNVSGNEIKKVPLYILWKLKQFIENKQSS